MFLEHFTYNVEFISLAGGSGTVFSDNTLTIGTYADFSIKRTMQFATSNIANLKIQDLRTGRFLFKTQEDLRQVAGTALSSITPQGFIPYNWPTPYKVNRLNQLKLSVADGSGFTNTIRLSLHGDHLWDYNPFSGYNPTAKRQVMPFTYESPVLGPITGVNTTDQDFIRIDDDADFICTKVTGIMSGTDGLIELVTQGDGVDSYWQNIPTDVNNFIGNSQFPHVLTSPRYIPRLSTVFLKFTNLTAGSNQLTVQLHGYKRF